MAWAMRFFGDNLRRSWRNQVPRSSTNGLDLSDRTHDRSCVGLPLISRSMANSASIRLTASIATGALRSSASS